MAVNHHNSSIKILQQNVQRSIASSINASVNAKNLSASIICLQEPHCLNAKISGFSGFKSIFYSNPNSSSNFYETKCAIVYNFCDILVINQFLSPTCVCVLVNCIHPFILCSVYYSFNAGVDNLIQELSEIEKILQTYSSYPIIIAGDLNSHHISWGSPVNNQRGDIVAEFVCKNNLLVLNDGSPTFVNSRYQSHIDLTIVNPSAISKICDWKVEDVVSASDHCLISFNYASHNHPNLQRPLTRVFSTRNVNWRRCINIAVIELTQYIDSIDSARSSNDIDLITQEIMTKIRQICDICLPKIKFKSTRSLPPELSSLNKALNNIRRRYQRQRCSIARESWRLRYIECVKNYKQRLIEYRTDSCKSFFSNQNCISVWQQVYKYCKPTSGNDNFVTIKDDNGEWTNSIEETTNLLLNKLFLNPISSPMAFDHDSYNSILRIMNLY